MTPATKFDQNMSLIYDQPIPNIQDGKFTSIEQTQAAIQNNTHCKKNKKPKQANLIQYNRQRNDRTENIPDMQLQVKDIQTKHKRRMIN